MRTVTSYLRRAYSSFLAHVLDIPSRLLGLLLFLLFLLLPTTGGLNQWHLGILSRASLFAIFAASWDLLAGRTGQISLGHALFLGAGGYGSALLFQYLGWPPWATVPLSMLIGVAVALLIGFPCLRLKGAYLALVTMALALIVREIIEWGPLQDITGGTSGAPVGMRLPRFFYTPLAKYYFTLLLLFVSFIALYKIATSKIGLVFISILDDEVASEAAGINVTKYKLMAFAISGLFASLVGAIYAHVFRYGKAKPDFFDLPLSFIPVLLTILGGIGTIYGPLVGSYIYYILDMYVLTKIFNIYMPGWGGATAIKLLIFAAIVILFVLKWPRGVARFVTDELEDLEEARVIEERGKWIWKTYKKK